MATRKDTYNMIRSDTLDETVTVKFSTNFEDKPLFTKAFPLRTTIKVIKSELVRLLRISEEQVISLRGEKHALDEQTTLAALGVEALGSIDLVVNAATIRKPNKNLLYGYIPTLDVIAVHIKNGKQHFKQLIVEIEDQQCKKEWLGGYRNTLSNKYYHHACTQTHQDIFPTDSIKKRTSISQTSRMQNTGTNTALDKVVQVSCLGFLPSQTDVVLNSKRLIKENEKKIEKRDCKESLDQNVSSVALENFDRDKISKIRKLSCGKKTSETKILYEYAKPVSFTNKSGKLVVIETEWNRTISKLQQLLYEYESKESFTAIDNMRNFFEIQRYNNGPYSSEICSLLNEEADLLKYRNNGKNRNKTYLNTLRSRIRQRIYHFLRYGGEKLHNTEDYSNTIRNVCHACTSQKVFLRYNTLRTHRKILEQLRNEELQKNQGYLSYCFKLCSEDIGYLLRHVWNNEPINFLPNQNEEYSQHRDLKNCILRRWKETEPWSPWNCLLLMRCPYKENAEIRSFAIISQKQSLISLIKNKQLQAKICFTGLLP